MIKHNDIIVISAINIFSGGTLTILQECISTVKKIFPNNVVIILVHNKNLLDAVPDNIKIVEFKSSRKFWANRLFFEYVYFWFYSYKLKPRLWLSLHDITPNVFAQKKAVYCHNPSPFYKLSKEDVKLDFKFALFNRFYSYLYKINIRKNSFVIVQQEWLRKAFIERYNISKVIVAHPEGRMVENQHPLNPVAKKPSNKTSFLYPALPRIFKNFEIIGDAVRILNDKNIKNFSVYITVDGKENNYSKYIYNKYKDLDQIKFIGLQTKEEISDLYNKTDCIIFPSKLETWGLPISEAKFFKKPILLIDLPYARETVGNYNYVNFFTPGKKEELAHYMESTIRGNIIYEPTKVPEPAAPFAASWPELFTTILSSS